MKLFKKSLTIADSPACKVQASSLKLEFFNTALTGTGDKFLAPCLIVLAAVFLTSSLLTTALAQPYTVDTKESVVTWKGSMAFAGQGEHVGYVSISAGDLTVERGQLISGKVEIDMNTIADKVHGSKNGLVDHLKDADFFDVKKYPFSTFAITGVTPTTGRNVTVTGNLTIKGITHEVSFPATTVVNGNVFNAIGKMTIDRTKWDVRYKSGKFFSDLADEAIADDIEFEMTIVAKK